MSDATRPEPLDVDRLRSEIERLARSESAGDEAEAREAIGQLLDALRSGLVRTAEPHEDGWRVNAWIKTGILLAFRTGANRDYRPFETGENPAFDASTWRWFDKDTLPLHPGDGVAGGYRIVPGGTSVRDGAFIAPGVVMMPPAFVNIGAYVDEGTMIDSHALVGSCAQVGKRVHLSAGAQLGGVLEPIGLRPVILEDDVLVAGNAGVFEGTLVGSGAVVGPGVQLTRSTAVYDLVRETVHRASEDQPLTIPEGAVVVPGARPARGNFAAEHDLQLYAPVIVKYRDDRTDASTALEESLR